MVDPVVDKITLGINGGLGTATVRWNNYKYNVKELLKVGNPYESMREVLARLGVTTVAGKDYSQQFGISLAARKAVDIVDSETHNLMAATGEVLSITPDGPDLTAEQQAQLWAQAEPLLAQLKLSHEEKSAMFIPDIGQTAGLLLGAAVAVAATPAQAAGNYILGICEVSQPDSGAEIRPTFNGDDYLYTYHVGDPRYQGFTFDDDSAKVTLVKAPAHGRVEHVESTTSNNYYHYYSNEGYVGQDRFVMQVEKNGVKVRIQYLMETPPEGPSDYLCNPDMWKISATTPALDNARLQALLGAANINNNVSVTFSDLPGSKVGQTTGQSITLDTNAAGYGWFVDSTPADNSEFLPTANPDVWIAKAGSDAAGKMDMLSVLLHEYGHALGMEHSANPNDFMAPDLQPGERRLPTSDELALMSQLVAQLQPGNATASATDATSPVPDSPTSPSSPTLPIGTALSALFIGRLRRTGYGSWVPVIDSVQIPAPQYELAINATLTNSNFASGVTDWNAQGNVTTNSTGTATLKNSTGADAQIAQAFNITSQDRYIEFTVANGLQQGNGTGPGDAFEVALDNAVTGAALAGTDGLSNSDGLLNIQADGLAHAASSVYQSVNADGTTTYVIDLQSALGNGAVTGTPAALSFDLIGFGNSQSQISIRDIKLLQTPLAFNENVATHEDAPVNLDPLAADPVAAGAAPQLNITQNPASGVLTQNADGSYAYVPNTHFFGSDSFQYSYTTNGDTSNVATVNIAVNEVAYPPTGSNSNATATAGKPYTFDPLAGAADINGNAMTAVLDTPPNSKGSSSD